MNRRDLRRALPPGPHVPGALQLVATWKRPAASLERMRQRYGTRITVQLPFQPPFVILSDPEEIKELFMASPEAVHPGEGARVLEPLIGRNSVILLDEAPHLEQRKLLLPAFHGAKMQRQVGLMAELAAREVDTWPRHEAVALHPRLQRLTLEIILRTVFGLEQGEQLDQLRDVLTDVLAFTENPLSVLPPVQRVMGRFGPTRRFQQQKARADELIFAVIAERREQHESDRDDVLAMLLEARHDDDSPMSPQELRDELMTALVAGHETTASQLAWMFERLAREPRVVKLLADELDAGDGDDYLTATINEVLRIKPVLPNAEPRLTMQPVTIGDFEYPAGVALLASAYLVHHDPSIYPEPKAFRPERFLDKQQPDDPGAARSGSRMTRAPADPARPDAERPADASGSRAGGKPGTYTWIPFGGGRRRCLGASFAIQEMKIVAQEVIARFELAPASPRPEATGRRSITFSPAGGATVILRERRPSAASSKPPEPIAATA